jgi:hypothetical protein
LPKYHAFIKILRILNGKANSRKLATKMTWQTTGPVEIDFAPIVQTAVKDAECLQGPVGSPSNIYSVLDSK